VAVLNQELVGFGRYSIQFFRNVGGTGFPFQAVLGATIPFGCVGPNAKCRVADTMAFVGGGHDEPLGVFVISGGTAVRISDEEIEGRLAQVADESTITMECRSFGFEQQIVVHLDNESIGLSVRGSGQADAGLWHVLRSKAGTYRPRNAVWFAGKHWVGDVSSAALGKLDDSVTAHFGEEPEWSFDAGLIYNDGQAAIVQDVELVGQFSGQALFFSMTFDGETWSREIARRLTGRRGEWVGWRPNVRMPRLAGLRFRGHGGAAIARTNVGGEPLAA
jgi:hypothetical protein